MSEARNPREFLVGIWYGISCAMAIVCLVASVREPNWYMMLFEIGVGILLLSTSMAALSWYTELIYKRIIIKKCMNQKIVDDVLRFDAIVLDNVYKQENLLQEEYRKARGAEEEGARERLDSYRGLVLEVKANWNQLTSALRNQGFQAGPYKSYLD